MGKEPVRVLQIIGLACGGGVESVIMNYYRHIDKSKVQFDFVVHKNPYKAFVDEARSMGAKVYEVTPYTKNIFKFTYEIYQLCKKRHYDIVHSNMNSLSFFPLLAAWLGGCKIRILHNHTIDNPIEGLRTFFKRILRPLSRLFANRYFACSQKAAEWMYGESALKYGKVTIINNAIDLNKFAFDSTKRQIIRKQLGLEGDFVIGHVGRFVQTKNHEFLIDVFAEVLKSKPNAKLLLVGDGPLKKHIENKVAQLGLVDKVIFTGVRNDVADLYNVMDVFLFPSLYEGLGMVAVEAQANGLPVIASIEVPREAILTNKVIFKKLDLPIKEWVNQILKIDKDSSRKSTIIINSNFDIAVETKKLEKFYLEVNYEYGKNGRSNY